MKVAAGGAAATVKQERRVDPSDGNAYPLSSFIEVYGGSRSSPPPQWAAATPKNEREQGRGGTPGPAPPAAAAAKKVLTAPAIDRQTAKAMKPPELKAALVARGASIDGNKKDLLARLLALL